MRPTHWSVWGLLLVLVLGLGWYSWWVNDRLHTEIDSVHDEVSELASGLDSIEGLLRISVQAVESNESGLTALESDLAALQRQVEDLRDELGPRPQSKAGRSLWELVDELYETIPDLLTPSPPQPGLCVSPDDATLRQDIRDRFTSELGRDPSENELSELLTEYRALHDEACQSAAATGCVLVGGLYYTESGDCVYPGE